MILTQMNPNHWVARRVIGGEAAAEARRVAPGTLWRVWWTGRAYGGLSAAQPHARVSGRLPEHIQRRMIVALLREATYSVVDEKED